MIRLLPLVFLLWFPLFAQGAACDSAEEENFLTFFFRFSGDKVFSTDRTVYPLKVLAQQYGIDELGNDLSVAKRLSRSKQQDTELPTLSSVLQNGNLIAKVHDLSATATVVQVFGESSEWGQTYHFSRKKNCWFLREFREHSISGQHWVEKQEFAPRSELVAHFYIKQDNQPLRAMMRVLNHLAFINESVSMEDAEDTQAELLALCEHLEADVDYAIADRENIAAQLREALSVLNRGGDMEGAAMLANISRILWAKIN